MILADRPGKALLRVKNCRVGPGRRRAGFFRGPAAISATDMGA
jgi:hypothetical protein